MALSLYPELYFLPSREFRDIFPDTHSILTFADACVHVFDFIPKLRERGFSKQCADAFSQLLDVVNEIEEVGEVEQSTIPFILLVNLFFAHPRVAEDHWPGDVSRALSSDLESFLARHFACPLYPN